MTTTDAPDGAQGTARVPVTLEQHDHVRGPFLHGTRAVLAPGAELVAGRASNFQPQRVMRHVYFTTLESTAAWGAQLASALAGDGDGDDELGHVYVVEPLGPFEDDPNVTDTKFPGNPTASYRSRHPLRVVRELDGWTPHPPEEVRRMLDGLASLRERGLDVIED